MLGFNHITKINIWGETSFEFLVLSDYEVVKVVASVTAKKKKSDSTSYSASKTFTLSDRAGYGPSFSINSPWKAFNFATEYGSCTMTATDNKGNTTTKTIYWDEAGSGTSSGTSSTSSILSIASLTIDDANTTGMKNGKYVIGTKLRIKAVVKSSNGVKSVRFILSGAKESDNSWDVSSTTITADSTAVATGVIHIKCIVTDKKGNTTSKTLDVTIYGEGDNYYAYYFFNKALENAFKENIGGANIILYNVYDVSPDQVDPAKKTILCYGHNYKTYNDIKNKKHKDSDLTLITSVIMPDAKNSSKVTIHLTESEFKRLIKYKGLAFKIQNKNCLTVHGIKCEVEVIYK